MKTVIAAVTEADRRRGDRRAHCERRRARHWRRQVVRRPWRGRVGVFPEDGCRAGAATPRANARRCRFSALASGERCADASAPARSAAADRACGGRLARWRWLPWRRSSRRSTPASAVSGSGRALLYTGAVASQTSASDS